MAESITEALEVRLGELAEKLQSACEDARDTAAREIADAARQRCTVKTGRLRDSIAAREGGVVSATAPYAAAVELGTYRRAATPFLAPAMRDAASGLRESARSAVRGALEGDE